MMKATSSVLSSGEEMRGAHSYLGRAFRGMDITVGSMFLYDTVAILRSQVAVFIYAG